MRYWVTLDSIGQRIKRISNDLSVAMRAFCYVFILGHLLQPTLTIKLGFLSIDESVVASFSKPIILFIILDLLRPSVYLLALHIIHLLKWKKYKKYEGNEDEKYKEDDDRSELIFELNPLEYFFISIFPNSLLFIKGCTVLYIVFLLLKILIC